MIQNRLVNCVNNGKYLLLCTSMHTFNSQSYTKTTSSVPMFMVGLDWIQVPFIERKYTLLALDCTPKFTNFRNFSIYSRFVYFVLDGKYVLVSLDGNLCKIITLSELLFWYATHSCSKEHRMLKVAWYTEWAQAQNSINTCGKHSMRYSDKKKKEKHISVLEIFAFSILHPLSFYK